MDRGFFSNTNQPAAAGTTDADFSDMRQLQLMTDKLKRLIHLLELNSNICQRLRMFFSRIASSTTVGENPHAVQDGEDVLEDCEFQLKVHASRLKTLVGRAEGVTSMVLSLQTSNGMT